MTKGQETASSCFLLPTDEAGRQVRALQAREDLPVWKASPAQQGNGRRRGSALVLAAVSGPVQGGTASAGGAGPGRAGHSPLVFHNEPDGVAHVPVLLVGAELHLHAHALLLALNVLQRVLHQIAHRPVLPGVQGLDVLEDVKHLQDKTERLGDNIFI